MADLRKNPVRTRFLLGIATLDSLELWMFPPVTNAIFFAIVIGRELLLPPSFHPLRLWKI